MAKSKPKCIIVHRTDPNNVGDIASNPGQYFLKDGEYEVVDIAEVHLKHFDESIPIIIGGGGLICNEFFGENLRSLSLCSDKHKLMNIANQYWPALEGTNKELREEFFQGLNNLIRNYTKKLQDVKSPRILWGAGHNADFDKKNKSLLVYPDYINLYDLIGIRDYGQMYPWVPCPSCMHPALRKKHMIKNDIIWFEHKKQLLKSSDFGSRPIPRFINSGGNVEQIIELLGSANTIITNSYHGAIWGQLLGKRVIVAEPWSSKFQGFRYQPYFMRRDDSVEQIYDRVKTYPQALEESITVTQTYWQDVKQCL